MSTHPIALVPDANGGPPPPPDRRRALVSAFVCDETRRLGREAGFPVAVLAATTDVARHAARLAATLYGAWTPVAYEAWPLPFDEGTLLPRDLAYRHLAFDARWMGAAGLPEGVALEEGSLSVALPDGASVEDLGNLVRAGLADLAFDRFARRPDRVRWRYAKGRPVVVAPRYALVTPGDIGRVTVADGLHRFRPCDLPRVAQVVALGVGSLSLAASVFGPRSGSGVGGMRHA